MSIPVTMPTPVQAEALHLYLAGRSRPEIAGLLGLEVSSVNSRLRHAARRLGLYDADDRAAMARAYRAALAPAVALCDQLIGGTRP